VPTLLSGAPCQRGHQTKVGGTLKKNFPALCAGYSVSAPHFQIASGASGLFHALSRPRDLFNTAAGNGIKQLESFISHPTSNGFIFCKQMQLLFGLQNWHEKYRTLISSARYVGLAGSGLGGGVEANPPNQNLQSPWGHLQPVGG